MSESSALSLLFAQLQARYPTSGLLTELVQLDADRSVVRAIVQLGSMTLATSMATAATVEQAEDQARLRVLALLGIHATSSHVPPLASRYSTPAQPLTALPDMAQFDALGLPLQDVPPLATTLPEVEPIAPPLPFPARAVEPLAAIATTPMAPVAPYATASSASAFVPETEQTFEAPPDDDAPDDHTPYDDVSYNQATYEEEPLEAYEPLVESASGEQAPGSDRTDAVPMAAIEGTAAKSKPRKASADKPPVATTEPSDRPSSNSPSSNSPSSNSPSSDRPSRDLSSLISQIGVEIDRIGWSKRQGSTYLQKTYGKKTRSELTDDELEDFLTYLNTQPSATLAT